MGKFLITFLVEEKEVGVGGMPPKQKLRNK